MQGNNELFSHPLLGQVGKSRVLLPEQLKVFIDLFYHVVDNFLICIGVGK